MIGPLPEWLPQRRYQRQRNIRSNRFGSQGGFPQTGSLLEQENVSLMLLNSLAFGEDERVNELIQQEVLPEMLCNELVEYPFPTPPDDDILGPINLGFCEVTGAPAGIYPREVHTLIVGASGKGKSTRNKDCELNNFYISDIDPCQILENGLPFGCNLQLVHHFQFTRRLTLDSLRSLN